MAKNMTRRTLAVGSAALLSVSGFTLPASADTVAVELSLNSGTSFNSVTGYTNEITLATAISADKAASDEHLVYRIGNAGEADVDINFGQTSATAATIDGSAAKAYEYDDADVLADSDGSGDDQFDEKDVVVDLLSEQGVYTASNLVSIGVKDASEKDFTITVQAFFDVNNNRKQDGTEEASNVITLNFYDEESISATSVVTAPAVNDGSVKVTTTTTPELNGQQLGDNFIDTLVTAQGNSGSVYTSNTFDSDGTRGVTSYDKDLKAWVSTSYLAYSLDNDSWTGTDGSIADIDLSVAPNTGAEWYVHNSGDSTSTAFTVFASSDSDVGNLSISSTFATVPTTGFDAVVISGSTNTDSGAQVATGYDGAYPLATGSATGKIDFTRTATTAVAAGDQASTNGLELDFGTLFFVKEATATQAASGTYTAKAYIGGAASANLLATATGAGVEAAVSDDTAAVVPAGADYNYIKATSNSSDTTKVRKGYKGDVPVTVTVKDEDGDTVPAGKSVRITSGTPTGTIFVNDTKLANGKTVDLTTDANGQVTFDVSSTTAAVSDSVKLTISPEGLTGAKSAAVTFTWEAAKHGLYDLKDTLTGSSQVLQRTIVENGSYTFNLALIDQWGQYLVSDADASYRYSVAQSQNSSGTTTVALDSDGVTEVTVTDSQLVGGNDTVVVSVDVQKLGSGGYSNSNGLTNLDTNDQAEWTSGNSNQRTLNVIAAQTDEVKLNKDTESTIGGGTAADFSGPITTVALADVDDRRTTQDGSRVYNSSNNGAVVSGAVRNAQTLVARAGAEVTVSGPASLFFQHGETIKSGSLTFIAEADGDVDIEIFSNVVQENSVVTVASGGSSATVKVTFSGGIDELDGVDVVITAPATVEPGSTLVWSAKVVDKFGNGVDTDQTSTANTFNSGDAAYKLTYTGKGLIVGTQPKDVKEASVDGDSFNVLLGNNDSGTITITASYDKNGDNDFLDAVDIVKTVTVTIGDAPVTQKVNAGSFKGFVAVYARGYEGQRLSAKIGNDWVIVDPIVNNQENGSLFRTTDLTGAGVDIAVRIYIDRVLMDTINMTTK